MTPHKANEYIGKTCRVTYTNIRGFKSSRVGVITHVLLRKVVMLLFNGEEDDYELYCTLKGARIYELKPNEINKYI